MIDWKTNYWQRTHKCDICNKEKVCKRIFILKFEPEPWGAYICSECENGKTMKDHFKKYPEVELRVP